MNDAAKGFELVERGHAMVVEGMRLCLSPTDEVADDATDDDLAERLAPLVRSTNQMLILAAFHSYADDPRKRDALGRICISTSDIQRAVDRIAAANGKTAPHGKSLGGALTGFTQGKFLKMLGILKCGHWLHKAGGESDRLWHMERRWLPAIEAVARDAGFAL